MLNKPRRLAVLFLAGLLGIAGCSAPAASPGPTIVVAAYPMQYLVSRLMPEANVVSLTPPGAEPHDLELSAPQVGQIATADLVVYEKGFQPAVDQAIANAAPRATVDVTTGVTMLPSTDATQLDPHIWLDPVIMTTMAQTIAQAVETVSPGSKDAIAQQLAALKSDLTALGQQYESGLATCKRRDFITSHAAFTYLAHRYGLTQIPIAGLDPTTEPSAARIADIQSLAHKYGITTIFYETLTSPAVAQSLANDLGLSTDVLDPIEGITPQSRGADYLAIMKSNLTALRTANGCS